jgi:hypothetical protein
MHGAKTHAAHLNRCTPSYDSGSDRIRALLPGFDKIIAFKSRGNNTYEPDHLPYM